MRKQIVEELVARVETEDPNDDLSRDAARAAKVDFSEHHVSA